MILVSSPSGEDDALARAVAGGIHDIGPHLPTDALALDELLAVSVQVDIAPRDAALHRRLGHRRRHPEHDALIQRLGNQVIAPEFQRAQAIGGEHAIRHILVHQLRQRARRRHLHRFGDAAGVDIERAAEDEREAEHIVDLVRVIAAAGADDGVRPGGQCVFRAYLRVRVGHGEDDRVIGHAGDHFLGNGIGDREPAEDISADHRLIQRAQLGIDGEIGFVAVDIGAPLINHAARIQHDDMLRLNAQGDIKLAAGDGRGAGAIDDHAQPFQRLIHQARGVDQGGAGDDGRAVLVIVKDRDIQLGRQPLLHLKAGRRGDILQVDAAEGGGHRFDGGDDLFGRLRLQFDIEDIDIGKALEEHALAFHYRFGSERAAVAEPQNRRAIGNDRHQVAARGQFVGLQGVAVDFENRFRHAGRIGEREVALGGQRFGGLDFDFARPPHAVIFQGVVSGNAHPCSPVFIRRSARRRRPGARHIAAGRTAENRPL